MSEDLTDTAITSVVKLSTLLSVICPDTTISEPLKYKLKLVLVRFVPPGYLS